MLPRAVAIGEGGQPHAPSLQGPPICPSCGLDFTLDAPISRDGLEIDPRYREARWQGQPVRLGPAAFSILYALAKAAGRTLSHGALMERAGSEGLCIAKGASVRIAEIRRVLPGVPIKSISGEGYAWRPIAKGPSA